MNAKDRNKGGSGYFEMTKIWREICHGFIQGGQTAREILFYFGCFFDCFKLQNFQICLFGVSINLFGVS